MNTVDRQEAEEVRDWCVDCDEEIEDGLCGCNFEGPISQGAMTSRELEFVEMMDFYRNEIAMAYKLRRVDAEILQGSSRGS